MKVFLRNLMNNCLYIIYRKCLLVHNDMNYSCGRLYSALLTERRVYMGRRLPKTSQPGYIAEIPDVSPFVSGVMVKFPDKN